MTELKLIIPTSVHPDYLIRWIDWEKFRYTMEGGDEYIEKYLVKFSERENTADFTARKSITPVPGFATAALIDVKNAIFQRMDDIKRQGGSKEYQEIIKGRRGGVDLKESTMNHFIGKEVLPELLFLGKIGIYIDMPPLPEQQTRTIANQVHPYFYTYKAEQIRNWKFTPGKEGKEFDKLLLEETHLSINEYGLPKTEEKRFRLLERENGIITVKFFDSSDNQVDMYGNLSDQIEIIQLNKIPFVLLELERSLLQDIANHQIALLNMESADVCYSLKANFPFYTEQYSGRFQSTHLQGNEDSEDHDGADVEVGSIQGRRYSKGLERPGFIHPSAEPLTASMEKQKNLKDDIRALVNLALSAIRPKFASAESKQMDEKGLESGLSFLGLVLEQGERQIARFFSEYENDGNIATVHYPERYNLKTDLQRLNEASAYADQMSTVPSKTYQKAVAKEIASTLLDSKISNENFDKIMKEIDTASWISSDSEGIHADIERGILSLETAAKARGYDPSEVEKAAQDHAKRIARIKEAQGGEEGTERGDPDEDEKGKSQDPTIQDKGGKAVRGKNAPK